MQKPKFGIRSTPRIEVSLRLLLVIWLVAAPVRPATIIVDQVGCPLVFAIESANSDTSIGSCEAGDPGSDTIELMVDVDIFSIHNETFGPTGTPVVTSDLIIEGSGRVIDRKDAFGPSFRIFAVAPGDAGTTLTLRNTTVSGGGIVESFSRLDGLNVWVGSGASLRLEYSILERSFSINRSEGDGGGIWTGTGSTVDIVASAIESNSVGDRGGGIFLGSDSTLTIDRSVIRGNLANMPDARGGGVFADVGSTVDIRDSSIEDNSSRVQIGQDTSGQAGGIFFQGETLNLTDSGLVENESFDAGGGLFVASDSTATLTNVILSDNDARGNTVSDQVGGGGGGVAVAGELFMTDSTVSSNEDFLGRGGGGIRVFGGGRATLTNTTLVGNVSRANDGLEIGGGLLADDATEVTLINSTVSRNSASDNGGGVFVDTGAELTVIHSTFVDNSADLGGESIQNSGGTVRVLSSALVGGDCVGVINDRDNNFTDSSGCPGAPILIGVDIDPNLADNGGPTETHALLEGSVAIDGGIDCPLDTDQRGSPRDDGLCDAGSYEFGFDDGSEFALSVTGECPGFIIADVTRATPGGGIRLYSSTAEGLFTLPLGGLCEGLELALDDPEAVTTQIANAEGERSFARNLTEGMCGLFLQAVDARTCTVTDVTQVP